MHPNLPNAISLPEQSEDLADLRESLSSLRDAVARDGRDMLPLLEDLIAAAGEAQRMISDQKARISYLEGLSNSDELTGLLNRRGFQAALGAALARAERRGETGLLVLCDLDRFKAINDSYGHLAGDTVLSEVASLLRRGTRRSDAVARIGGDEFAVLMSDTRRSLATDRLARLEETVKAMQVTWNGQEIPVSASFGTAPYKADTAAEGLLFLADRALYANKRPKLVRGRA